MRILPTAASRHDAPAQLFTRAYALALGALTGSVGVITRSTAPDHVFLRFQTREFAAMADAVLRDTVLGANLVFVDPAGRPFTTRGDLPAWANDPTNLARSVAALPGVVSFREYRGRAFGFTVDTAATRDALALLVEPTFTGRATSFWELAVGPS